MTIIHATGFALGSAFTPSLHVSGGAGDGRNQVHLLFREQDGEETRTMLAWFDADDLLDAITDALEISRQTGTHLA